MGKRVKRKEMEANELKNAEIQSDEYSIVPSIDPNELEDFLDIKLVENKRKVVSDLRKKKQELIEISARELGNEETALLPVTEKDYEARIYVWMIQGWTVKKITDELILNYGIKSEVTAERLIRNVNHSCSSVSVKDMDVLRSMYIETYFDLYRKAIEKKDYATAKNILDSVVKLQGLITKRTESRIENVFTVDFN